MRTSTLIFSLTLCVLTSFLAASATQAGTLDLAVVQFSGIVEEEQINQALEGQELAKAAFGDRFEIRDRRLRSSPVLFSQTLSVRSGDRFLSSTRVGGQRAEVEGQIGRDRLNAQVVLSEGIQKPLRRFSQLVYRGNGPLISGPARVLGLRQIDSRQTTGPRGQARVETTQTTVALIYQFRP
jgi:hypothetical protein